MIAPPSNADMAMEMDNSYMDAEDMIHNSNTVSGRKRKSSPIHDCSLAATTLRKLNNQDPDDLTVVTCSDMEYSDTNSTQTTELEPSISIWDRALQQLPNNWERGFLYAMRDICEDITRQQTHPHLHQQIAIHEEGEESINMEDFMIEYDNDSNSINHNVDDVNNVDNDNSNIIVHDSFNSIDNNIVQEKKKTRRGKKQNRDQQRRRQKERNNNPDKPL